MNGDRIEVVRPCRRRHQHRGEFYQLLALGKWLDFTNRIVMPLELLVQQVTGDRDIAGRTDDMDAV